MGAFQVSILEAMKSLREEMQSIKKSAKEVELDQSSTSASKPGPSKQSDNLPPNTTFERTNEAMELDVYGPSPKPGPSKQSDNLPPNTTSERTDEAMELDMYGPLPPRFGDAQIQTTVRITTRIFQNNPNRCVCPEPKNIGTNANTRFGPNIFLSRHPQRRISPLLTRKGLISPLGPLLN